MLLFIQFTSYSHKIPFYSFKKPHSKKTFHLGYSFSLIGRLLFSTNQIRIVRFCCLIGTVINTIIKLTNHLLSLFFYSTISLLILNSVPLFSSPAFSHHDFLVPSLLYSRFVIFVSLFHCLFCSFLSFHLYSRPIMSCDDCVPKFETYSTSFFITHKNFYFSPLIA